MQLGQQQSHIALGIRTMKTLFIALAALSLAAPALAETPAIERNAAIYSAEGTKLGKVDRVITQADGSTSAVRLIYRGKFIAIPTATLSTGDKGLMTSLSNAELKKL